MSDGEDDTAAAMAAAMGFSSFGAQQPNKRRKFNPSTDAYIDEDADHFITTTGSNMVPLGIRNKNTDEIDLDEDEDEGHTQPEPQHNTADGTDAHDYEPQYLDTSRPSAPVGVDAPAGLQDRIDAIVDSSEVAQAPPPPIYALPGGGRYEQYTLPAKPTHSNRGGPGTHQRNMNRTGDSETKWWKDYYDPSFIVNPWEQLEKDLGLEPRGAWVSWEAAKAAQA
ncbi:hypothetical protein F4808DRAFT_242582 [Astrocystis sublimbata]|nr:hypothetical protein F4808DRAFT_242582 [Astrocystis sublimbata]